MPEVDPSIRAPAPWVAAALLACIASAGCGHASPCGGSVYCAEDEVCGLAGACAPRPSLEATRFVRVLELPPVATRVRGYAALGDRVALGGADDEAVELRFGDLPEGELVEAVLRLHPYPGAARFDGEAVAEVRRGRRVVTVGCSVGTAAPVLVEVTELLRGAAAGEPFALSIRVRSEATYFAASSRIASPELRPSLSLVLR